jgi:hypothetical protein
VVREVELPGTAEAQVGQVPTGVVSRGDVEFGEVHDLAHRRDGRGQGRAPALEVPPVDGALDRGSGAGTGGVELGDRELGGREGVQAAAAVLAVGAQDSLRVGVEGHLEDHLEVVRMTEHRQV